MSADLFAEFAADSVLNKNHQTSGSTKLPGQPTSAFGLFDDFNPVTPPATQAQPPQSQQYFQSLVSVPTQPPVADDNDEWGDFEGGSSTLRPALPVKQDSFALVASLATLPAQRSNFTTFPSQATYSSPLRHVSQSDQNSWHRPSPPRTKAFADPSVLFDAETGVDEDDDFGDFEDADTKATPIPPTVGSSGLADLLGDLGVSQPQPAIAGERTASVAIAASKPESTIKPKPLPGFGVVSKPTVPPVTSEPEAETEDAWDTFDDWEASIPMKAPASSSRPEPVKALNGCIDHKTPTPIVSPTTDDLPPGELPPTNVPPPGVLLSMFPALFADAQEKLFKPMAAQTLPMRNKLMAETGTISYLQGYLMLVNVAAHITAGRKLRWKRDQHLSQSMRIGPASSRATSGMKLAGLDRGENMKEEREVSDVVRVWKEQVGRVRHIVSGVNQIKANTLGVVPDLQETMPIKTLKQAEGGVPARLPCMLCGLKREERVTAMDLATDDSFGEWWIDQVNMHRGKACGCAGSDLG
jgi:hypothetical protein